MLPTREIAEKLLIEAEGCNPGPWGNHSRVAAHCAEKIAQECGDLDSDKAYVLGLLHDIGRKFGVRHLGHVSDGYSYMMSLGYDEAARICLTHSFHNRTTDDYIGNFDTTEEELELIQNALKEVVMDEYDRLIQLCDSIAGAEGVMDMEERMNDVKRRYGAYPQEKWDANLELKAHFEKKMGKDIYTVVEKNIYKICPTLENEKFLLRLVQSADCDDLLQVYSDKNALPFFNSDNCDGDNFYYTTVERMHKALEFWELAYQNGWFARLSIMDKTTSKIIGTIELCLRVSEDSFHKKGILRIDVGSDYEREDALYEIITLITPHIPEMLGCEGVITKAPVYAVERIKAVERAGFVKSEDFLIGKTGYAYDGYWVMN